MPEKSEALVDDDHSRTVSGFSPRGPGKFSKMHTAVRHFTGSQKEDRKLQTVVDLWRCIHARDLQQRLNTLWNHDISR